MTKRLSHSERSRLVDDLYQKYAKSGSAKQRFIYWRKKYAWLLVVRSAKLFKRLMDIVLSLALLIIFSPIMLIIALAIKLYDGGPVFYISNRVGKWGKEFPFPKFRSMQMNADALKESLKEFCEDEDKIRFKLKTDPRVTPIGKFIRKTSLDELPQLWTILKGDMSLVGPRPPLPSEVELYNLEQRRRLDVKPGLTGIWQVSGRSEVSFQKQVKLDKEYIESQSLWLDIKILLKTIPAVIFGKGAY